ncbi:hypothetical protein [Zoogloea sp.]|uniref:hypothetical protein n=1 Tax=Zoogloea sp. TaxID=49181 RepID=UPI0026261EDD|nr:hypothetical protein [Zoogloea sp.]MDD3352298.1 hypothetical protein [Zoogloea sp.]
MNTQSMETPRALFMTVLALAGIAFGVQQMARSPVSFTGVESVLQADSDRPAVQDEDIDVLWFVHQNSGA